MMRLVKTAVATLIFISVSQACYSLTDKEVKEKIIPIIDASVMESYSTSDSGDDVWGLDVSGVFSPVYKIDDDNFIIPLYQGGYQRSIQVVNEDEGYRDYAETMYHNNSLSYFTRLTDNLTCKLTSLMRLQFNSETNDEDWGDGLYDYEDLGGAVDFKYKVTDNENWTGEYSAIFEYYYRNYPNYESLISLLAATAPENDEKDYHGYQLISGYGFGTKNFSGDIGYTLLVKQYTDKKVIEQDGVLDTSKRRSDFVHMWNAKVRVPYKEYYSCYVNTQAIYNVSNQNYYDSRGSTLDLTDDVFTDSYYNYFSFGGGPGVNCKYPMPKMENKAMDIDLNYNFTFTEYIERRAQEWDSSYTGKEERDIKHTIKGHFLYPVTEHINFVALASLTMARSNMDYDRYYRYEYEIFKAACGLNTKF